MVWSYFYGHNSEYLNPKKVKYKFDGYGIGHDQAEHHKFKWWERAFETAAASIEVGDGKPVTNIRSRDHKYVL